MHDPSHRLAWALTGVSALFATFVVHTWGARSISATEPVSVTCGALGLLFLLGALGCHPTRYKLAPIITALRWTLALLLVTLWQGETRELWGAVTISIASQDKTQSPTRPLMPIAIAVAITLAWNTYRPGPPAARTLLVALIAAITVARGAKPQI